MTQIVIHQPLIGQLDALSQPVALVDEHGRQVGHFIPSVEGASTDQFPPHCKTEEDRQLYRSIVANLPSEEDLNLIATVPTPEWIAQKEMKQRQ
jgi:hypothetical protein